MVAAPAAVEGLSLRRYKVVLTATNSAGRSAPRTLRFRIVKR